MKQRWLALASLLIASTVVAEEGATRTPLTDAEGRSLATLAVCNDCRSGSGDDCRNGALDGWLDGAPCGSCLMKSNAGVLIRYPFDLLVFGRLTDPEGAPVKDRFVKLFLPNGWGVRTRTNETGDFRMTLGATAERTSQQPRVVNIGTHVDTTKGDDPQFSIYMLPEGFKPCAAGDVPAEAAKQGKGKAAKHKKK